jgi:cytochrome c oxidase subunit 2
VYQLCAPCHGLDGSGNRALGAPAIAGIDAWYVGVQLDKFKRGVRGSHPDDLGGSRMQSIAQGLQSEREIAAVSEYVARLPPAPTPAVIEGDSSRGRQLWARCAGCHGPVGSGNPANSAPPLDRTDDWYLLTQLGKFRRGLRGTHPDDRSGAIMRSVALTLPDDRSMSDLVAYITSLR